MAAPSIGARSTLLRTLFKKPPSFPSPLRSSLSTTTTTTAATATSPPPNFLRRTPASPSPSLSSSFRLPRELCTLLPAYTAIASACLVSRLPAGVNSSAECRFANYVSPI